jgi:predicted phage tail protein
MKEVILHGILAKEFGQSFEMQISRPKDCIKAINANLDNFINRINDLASQGFHYTIIVDNKKIQDIRELEIQNNFKRIDLVPLIVGSGAVIGGMILTGLATTLGGAAAGTAMAAWVAAGIGSVVAGMVGGLVLTAVTMGLQMLLQEKPDGPAAASSATSAIKESFEFSNKANLASQGSSIPIGYGRLKVGSQVVQFTLKAFSSQIPFNEIAQKFVDNSQVISTKTTSNNIGRISGTAAKNSKFTWSTSGITQLRLNGPTGKVLNLNQNSAIVLLGGSKTSWVSALGPYKPVTFWISYPGGSRTFTVNSLGKFSG